MKYVKKIVSIVLLFTVGFSTPGFSARYLAPPSVPEQQIIFNYDDKLTDTIVSLLRNKSDDVVERALADLADNTIVNLKKVVKPGKIIQVLLELYILKKINDVRMEKILGKFNTHTAEIKTHIVQSLYKKVLVCSKSYEKALRHYLDNKNMGSNKAFRDRVCDEFAAATKDGLDQIKGIFNVMKAQIDYNSDEGLDSLVGVLLKIVGNHIGSVYFKNHPRDYYDVRTWYDEHEINVAIVKHVCEVFEKSKVNETAKVVEIADSLLKMSQDVFSDVDISKSVSGLTILNTLTNIVKSDNIKDEHLDAIAAFLIRHVHGKSHDRSRRLALTVLSQIDLTRLEKPEEVVTCFLRTGHQYMYDDNTHVDDVMKRMENQLKMVAYGTQKRASFIATVMSH